MVARILTPFSPDIDKSSVGKPAAFHSTPIFVWRSSILGLLLPACEIPLKSPLMSINKVGTPLADNFSAKFCKVLVLPVPVAPAISPWRLNMRKGAFTKVFSNTVSSSFAVPKTMDGP